jgi:hypothetical protein
VENEAKPVEEEAKPMPETIDDDTWRVLEQLLQQQQEASPMAEANRKIQEEAVQWHRAFEHSQQQEDPEEPREGPSGRGGRRR